MTVVATDADGGDNQISYSLLPNNETDALFTIDQDGTISNQQPFPEIPQAEVCILYT